MFRNFRNFLRGVGLKETRKSFRDRYPQFKIGRKMIGNPTVHWDWMANLTIGNFTSFHDTVQIFLGGDHRYDWVTARASRDWWNAAGPVEGHPKTKGDVTIGNDCYIGTESVVMSGVTIGDGAVIGLRAVVTSDVPPYAIAVGNPARVVKKRFGEETISRLLKVRWWDWEDEKIERSLPLLLNEDVEAFLKAAENNQI